MTSTNPSSRIGGYDQEVDHQKLGPALLIASSLVLAIRTARWSPTHTDGFSNVEWDKEVEHSRSRFVVIVLHDRYPIRQTIVLLRCSCDPFYRDVVSTLKIRTDTAARSPY
jgi:hypothetical protein